MVSSEVMNDNTNRLNQIRREEQLKKRLDEIELKLLQTDKDIQEIIKQLKGKK